MSIIYLQQRITVMSELFIECFDTSITQVSAVLISTL